MTIWTTTQAQTFLHEARDHPFYLVYRLLLICGLRRGEALGIQRNDLDLVARTLHIRRQLTLVAGHSFVGSPKSAKGVRTVHLDEETAVLLGVHRQSVHDEVRHLSHSPVSSKAWHRFLNTHAPLRAEQAVRLAGRSLTMAQNKQGALDALYQWDHRAAPWAGTALGVLQAVNTYEHHEGTVRGATRPERNMLRAITGEYEQLDHTTWNTLTKALQTI